MEKYGWIDTLSKYSPNLIKSLYVFIYVYEYVSRFLINHRHFVTVRLESQHLVWNNQCKCSCVGGNIFSEICFYLDINNRGFEFLFLLADMECEKWVKSYIIAKFYVGLGYQFIHTKEFNFKQGCITIHPRKFLAGERQIIINRGVSIWV